MAEYIERDKLSADFELCNKQNPRWTPQRVASLIARANAADVAPVVHGRWIKPTKIGHRAFDIPHCSACDGVPCGVDENTNYCPNCGAHMKDGE